MIKRGIVSFFCMSMCLGTALFGATATLTVSAVVPERQSVSMMDSISYIQDSYAGASFGEIELSSNIQSQQFIEIESEEGVDYVMNFDHESGSTQVDGHHYELSSISEASKLNFSRSNSDALLTSDTIILTLADS